MSWQIALRLPMDEDLRPFLAVLQQAQVPHRVAEEQGQQVLWVPAALVAQIQHWHRAGLAAESLPRDAGPAPARAGWHACRQTPMTSVILLLSVLVALLSWMGSELAVVRWLTLQDFRFDQQYLYFVPLSESLAQGQWWRLFSSMFLHFWVPGMGPLHLVMNGFWFWLLGRRIEQQQGSWVLLGLSLLLSVAASLAQYWESGPGIAGGLSGVLYGLLGYCWMFNVLVPRSGLKLPSGLLGIMLLWLLLCWFGVFSAWVSIANGAHIGGLLAGCVLGLLAGAWARQRRVA